MFHVESVRRIVIKIGIYRRKVALYCIDFFLFCRFGLPVDVHTYKHTYTQTDRHGTSNGRISEAHLIPKRDGIAYFV